MMRDRQTGGSRRAFTLLELILALSLTVVIMGAISMAIDLHLRSLDKQRGKLEESQLARSILRILANDIRGVVLHYEQDVSGIEAMLGDTAAAALGAAGAAQGDPNGEQGGDGGTGDLAGDLTGEEATSTYTQNLVQATELPTIPGVYGNQYELQLDISRLPRPDQWQLGSAATAAEIGTIVDIPSDVKTVTYYVQSAAGGLPAAGSTGTALALDDSPLTQSGLVRRELDREITRWQLTSGIGYGLEESGDIVAPEVVGLEFSYFDGAEWRIEWDTEIEGALPRAIQILLVLESQIDSGTTAASGAAAPLAVAENTSLRTYRLVVPLPVRLPPSGAGDSATTDSGLEAIGL